MTCEPLDSTAGLIGTICRSGEYLSIVRDCPVCGYTAELIGFGGGWYSFAWTCTICGDQFCDGELAERPFRRGWRLANVQHAVAGLKRQSELRAG